MTKHSLVGLLLALLFAAGLTACDTESAYDYTVSTDCMVTGVTLGGIQRTVHYSRPDGSDSTNTYTVTGALYPMSIDQVNNRIYNLDSLPMGSDVSKVTFKLFNVTGVCAIRSLVDGKDSTFVMTDSTDFTRARNIKVYSADGTYSRDYSLEVRVHNEEGDSMNWTKVGAADAALARLTNTQAVATADGRICVFGLDGERPVAATTNAASPAGWTVAALNYRAGYMPETRGVVNFKNRLYALTADGTPVSAATPEDEWTPVGATEKLVALTGATPDSLLALTAEGFAASADGVNWVKTQADTPEMLPSKVTGAVCLPSRTDDKMTSVVVTGEKDGNPVVWKRDFDTTGDDAYMWLYYPATSENTYYLPQLKQASLAPYDGEAWFVGRADDADKASFYISRDFGRTWKPRSFTGVDFGNASALSTCVDAAQGLWVICEGTGNVWRGRINRLGWADIVTEY